MKKQKKLNQKLYIFLIFILSINLFFIYFSFKPTEIITKFIVKKNYKYFVLQENNNKFLNIYFDFVVQNFFKNNFLKEEKDIKIISKKTKSFFVDQEESFFYKINPLISKVSIGGVLIYGYGACESVNGILGLRLSKNIKNIELFSLYDRVKNSSPHTILRLKENNKPYFIDIWGLNRDIKYTLQLSKLNKELDLDVYSKNLYEDGFNKNLFNDGFVIKKYDINSLLNVGIKKIINIDFNFFKKEKKEKKEKKIIFNTENKTKNNLTSKKIVNIDTYLIKLFIEARFKHMNNNMKEANELYNEIVNKECELDFCKISKLLLI